MNLALIRPNFRLLSFIFAVLFLLTASGLFLSLQSDPEDPISFQPQLARENFPSLALSLRLRPILSANISPKGSPSTPLFIGFTRNWPILQQAVVSYLTAGWPASDIIVVDNTGTVDSNSLGLLTLQNPFFLNHTRLQDVLGVHVLTTPTLLTFAQLQNFYLSTAIARGWDHYWWSHMDSVAVSWEDKSPYMSLHQRVLKDWSETAGEKPWKWGIKFYRYDRLALVNVQAYKDVGGWDTHIPFYATDCDFHQRLRMRGWELPNVAVGMVFDVGGTLPDLGALYPTTPDEKLAGERYRRVVKELGDIDVAKHTTKNGRNFWQGTQRGGQGEPFYRDPAGFERGIFMWTELGRKVFRVKWGHKDCGIVEAGRKFEDAWRMKKDFWW